MTADDLIKKILDYLNNNNTYTTNSYSIGFGSEIDDVSSQLQKLKDTLNFMNGNFDELSGKTRKQLEQEKKYVEDLKQIKDEKNKVEKEINKIINKQREKYEKKVKADSSKTDSEGNLNEEGRKEVEKRLNNYRESSKKIQEQEKKLDDLREQRYKLELENLSEEQKRQRELQKQHNKLSKYVGSDIASKIQNSKLGQTYNAFKDAKGGGGAGKFAAAVAIANAIGDVVSAVSNAITDYQLKDIEKQKESISYQYDVLKKTFAAKSKLVTKQLEIQSKILTTQFSNVTSFLTKGVKESAFNIANSALEINSDLLKYKIDKTFTNINLQHELYVRNAEYTRTTNRLDREQTQGIVDGIVGGVDMLTGGIFGGVTGAIKSLIVNRNKTLAAEDTEAMLRLERDNDFQQQMRDFYQQTYEQMTGAIQSIAKSGLDMSNDIEEVGLRIDKSIREGMATFGFADYNNYKNNLHNATKSLAVTTSTGKTFHLDKNDDDVIKRRSDYVYNTGRNIEMSNGDIQKSFLMSELWDEQTVNSLTAQMDYFNHSVEDSVDMFYEMYQTANNMGISNKKYAETLNKNLKLAQKYTFKDGTKGLMRMALWAEKTRFNIDSLDSMISKVQDGGLEGTIIQAAQLQVLGGSAAMGADPLAIQYEAWSDPEAFAKRMYDMTKEYASFNSETGEVDIKGLNAMMVANIAKAQGRSPEDLRAELTQRVKNEQIDSQISNLGFTDSQKQLLYSKAQYDREDGKWKISINGEKKDINKLSESDFERIAPIEMDIKDYVFEIYNLLKEDKGVKEYTSTQMGFDTLDSTTKNAKERINNTLNWFDEHAAELKSIVEEGSTWITKEQKIYQDLLTNNAANIKTSLDLLQTNTNDLQVQIKDAIDNIELFKKAVKAKTTEEQLEYLNQYGEKNGMEGMFIGSPKAHDISTALEGIKPNELKKIKTLLSNKDVNSSLYKDIIGENEWYVNESGIPIWLPSVKDVWFKKLSPELQSMAYGTTSERKQFVGYLEKAYNYQFPAAKVTPINDGSVQLAQSDPQDVALFAKTGGPFDTLFNGIFAKINEISKVLPRSMEYIMPMERIFNEINHSKGTANNSKIQIDTVKIELNGKLELSNSNGQSVDIINEIKNNPILLRTLTQLISESMEKNINGGKSTYTGGVVKPRFN